MKSFMTLAALAASATLVGAQATFNSTTGEFTCPIANATYCAGDSLSTNIIIRCNGFVGQPGNCDDNLDGEFPQGDSFSPCWASSATSGIAACSKNCIVYGGSGNSDTFTLPNCVPSATPSSSTAVKTHTTPAGTGVISSNATLISTSSATSIKAITTPTITTSVLPVSSGTKLPVGTGSVVPFPSNSTSTVHSSSSGVSTSTAGSSQGGSSSSATATPKSPPSSTVSTVPTFTGAANSARAGSALAVAGFFAAYFL